MGKLEFCASTMLTDMVIFSLVQQRSLLFILVFCIVA